MKRKHSERDVDGGGGGGREGRRSSSSTSSSSSKSKRRRKSMSQKEVEEDDMGLAVAPAAAASVVIGGSPLASELAVGASYDGARSNTRTSRTARLKEEENSDQGVAQIYKVAEVYHYEHLKHTPDWTYLNSVELVPDPNTLQFESYEVLDNNKYLCEEWKERETPPEDDLYYREESAETTELSSDYTLKAVYQHIRVSRTRAYDYTLPSRVQNSQYVSLETLENRTLPLKRVLGMEGVKKAFNQLVARQIQNPALYAGMIERDKMLLVYGPPGSGKLTLVKSYCRELALMMVHVHGLYTTNPDETMRSVVEFAVRSDRPCVIYFDHCDHWFIEGHPSQAYGRAFFHFFHEEYLCNERDIWVVFGQETFPTQFLEIQRHALLSNSRLAQPPNMVCRRAFFHRILEAQYELMGGRLMSEEDYIRVLVLVCEEASCNSTYGEIMAYCRSVFKHTVVNLPLDQMALASLQTPSVHPSYEDFTNKLFTRNNGRLYISPHDTLQRSSQYRSQEEHTIRASNPSLLTPNLKAGQTAQLQKQKMQLQQQQQQQHNSSSLSSSSTAASKPIPLSKILESQKRLHDPPGKIK